MMHLPSNLYSEKHLWILNSTLLGVYHLVHNLIDRSIVTESKVNLTNTAAAHRHILLYSIHYMLSSVLQVS